MAKLFHIPRRPLTDRVARRPLPRRSELEMMMDERTYLDLEIFHGEGNAPSLFALMNRTRTTGGARVLQARWRKPWSKLEHIRAVQDSVRYLIQHRAAFDILPGESVVSGIDRYLYAGLPLLTTENRFEFVIEAIEVRFGDLRHYWQIVAGVQRTMGMIRALQHIASRPELGQAPGELGPWLEEMRVLVRRPLLEALPQQVGAEMTSWRWMRLDKLLRQDQRDAVERLLHLVFEIDALLSMADAVREFGLVIPELHDGPLELVAEGIFHPFVAQPVANPLRVDQTQRLLFLTGPNMAGKTTYLRAAGTAAYLAHLGMGVPARSCRFSPCDALFSAISLNDNVREGVSFFRAEALRVKSIAQAVAEGRRVIALMDEPFKGTNVKDALDASRAVLVRLADKDGNIFLVSSHLIELGDALEDTGSVDCRRFEASERGGRLEFDYVLRPGVSSQRLGVRVLDEEGVFDLLDQESGVLAEPDDGDGAG